jgi:hypothetical protein
LKYNAKNYIQQRKKNKTEKNFYSFGIEISHKLYYLRANYGWYWLK